MKPFAPRELLATLGRGSLPPLAGFYVFSLVPALLIGAAPLPQSALVAVVFWSCGATGITAGLAYCLWRFRTQTRPLLLPGRRAVLTRAVLWLTSLIVLVPAISFWFLSPGSRHWLWLLAAMPALAAIAVPVGLQLPETRASDRRFVHSPRTQRSGAQAIRVFIGGPFVSLQSGTRARTAALLGLLVWSLTALLCLLPSGKTGSTVFWTYVALSGMALWIWFMVALSRFALHRPGNSAELALLPGLGSTAERRHALYRAMLARPLWLVLCGFGSYFIVACWHSPSAPHIERSLVGMLVMLLFCCTSVFQIFTSKPDVGVAARVMTATVFPLLMSQTLVQILSGHAGWMLPVLHGIFLLCVAMLVGAQLTVIWVMTSGLGALPHPFVLYSD